MQIFSSINRIYNGIRAYKQHAAITFYSLLVSCVIHIFAASSCILFAAALEGPKKKLPFVAFYALAPLGLLTTAVPIAPAGVGTGHAAFSWLFLLMGYQSGANVFSLFVIYQLLWGALGGFVYLRYKSNPTAA